MKKKGSKAINRSVGGGLALIVVGAVTSNVQIGQIGIICILVAFAYGVGIQVGQEKNDD